MSRYYANMEARVRTNVTGTIKRMESRAAELLAQADVQIGGNRPWDIKVHDPRLYARVFSQGSLGLGEAYMDGWWDVDQPDEFFSKVLRAQVDQRVTRIKRAFRWLVGTAMNFQAVGRAFEIGERHYDTGNSLFERMLDSRMNYSCGYWKDAASLDEAQEAKLDLCCRKLELQPGMSLLDIGCGWGGMAHYAADRYGVKVVGLTVSKEQADYARKYCENLPVEIRIEDYRAHHGHYDRIVSIGMFEHVGHRNYRTYFRAARRLLKPEGRFLLHSIGTNVSITRTDPWIEKYIFPNSMLPSPRQITKAMEGLFVLEDWHNFGQDYDPTLMAWHRNFENAWDDLSKQYDERFYRMWRLYLLMSAGAFRARDNQLYQLLLSPRGVLGGLRVPR